MIAVAEIHYGKYLTFVAAEFQAQIIFGVFGVGEEVRLVGHPGFQYLQGASNDLAHGVVSCGYCWLKVVVGDDV